MNALCTCKVCYTVVNERDTRGTYIINDIPFRWVNNQYKLF